MSDDDIPAPDAIPATMKRLVVMAPGKDIASCKIEIEEVPVPKPAPNQVLVKVVAAAINPSDYGAWARCKPEQCPLAMGMEGCGVVVQTGEGSLLSSFTTSWTCPVGTKVGFTSLKNNQGSYSEYVVADAVGGVFPMPEDLPIEDAASFFVNPYTAIGICDMVRSEGSKAFVLTAAASQLGQMLVKLAPTEGVEMICVVRREEQSEMLKKLGAKHVIVSGSGDDDSWKEELQAKITELEATVAFDAVAGTSTGDLLDVLPPSGTVYVFGGLSGRIQNIDVTALIYKEKKLKGFFLSSWIKNGGMLIMMIRMITASKKVNPGLSGGWSSSQFKDTTLEKARDDIVELLGSSITGQKLRIRFESS
jgi:NADPH2:quinone reductase